MATAVDSVAPRESAALPSSSRLQIVPRILAPVLESWHLLSLDAPSIAALWSWFFARAMRIELPWHAPLLLALGTWLVYVADRVLDGLRRNSIAPLRQRHLFHARHRKAFLATALAASPGLLWLICTRMTTIALHEDTLLFSAALCYLMLVHLPGGEARSWLPKELAVALVFAAATAVPAWSRLDSRRAALLPAIAAFAALCWLNCVAIERWENLPAPSRPLAMAPAAHRTTRWGTTHLLAAAFIVAALSAMPVFAEAVRAQGPNAPNTLPLYLAACVSALCLALLERCRGRFSAPRLRIAADLALLTPLLFLPFVG